MQPRAFINTREDKKVLDVNLPTELWRDVQLALDVLGGAYGCIDHDELAKVVPWGEERRQRVKNLARTVVAMSGYARQVEQKSSEWVDD